MTISFRWPTFPQVGPTNKTAAATGSLGETMKRYSATLSARNRGRSFFTRRCCACGTPNERKTDFK